MEHLGLRVVLFSWSSDQVWVPGSLSGDVRLSHSVGQGHPGQLGVLVSGCLGLVWAQDLWFPHLVGQLLPAAGKCHTMPPLVHGHVGWFWVVVRVGWFWVVSSLVGGF